MIEEWIHFQLVSSLNSVFHRVRVIIRGDKNTLKLHASLWSLV